MFIYRKFILFIFAVSAIFFSSFASGDEDSVPQNPIAVIELFTSQGCNSCPPADEILADYSSDSSVLAFSWHVDYWDYLGWKDTFSSSEFTSRQKLYAAEFRRRGIYTPQAVINGRTHVVGSRRRDIANTISTYETEGKDLTVPVSVIPDSEFVKVAASSPDLSDTTAWIIYFDREQTVDIQRGENRGKLITYHNVVKDYSMLGMSDQDGKLDITLPIDELKRNGTEACAILVQKSGVYGTLGPIVGAGVLYDLQDL